MIDFGRAGRESWTYIQQRGAGAALLRVAELVRLGLLGRKLRLLFMRPRRQVRLKVPHPFPYDAHLARHRRAATSDATFRARKVGTTKGQRARVIFVVSDFGIGGGNRVIHRHLTTLAEHGYRTELWSLVPPLDLWDIHPAIKRRAFETYEDLIAVLRTVDAIKVATWWETALPVWLSSVRHGLPVCLLQDIETSYYRYDPPMTERVLDSYRPEFTYLANTRLLKERMETELRRPAIAIGLGYCSATFHPVVVPVRSKPVLLVACRREPLKNFAYTKEIIRQVRDVLGVECEIVAFGPDGNLCRDLPDLHFVAAPTDQALAALYASASCFLSTSIHEGFGLPSLEAMACGCPVVTTDAVGNREYIADGSNRLVIPQDDVIEAALRVRLVLVDEQTRRSLRRAGLETASRYTWSAVDRRLLAAMSAIAAFGTYGDPVHEASLGSASS